MDSFCGSPLWNSSGSDSATYLDVPPCFQQSVLVWLPCGYMLLLSPIYAVYLCRAVRIPIPHNWLNLTKTVLSVLYSVIVYTQLHSTISDLEHGVSVYPVDYTSPVLLLISTILTILLAQLERLRGFRISLFISFYWFLVALKDIISLRSASNDVIRSGSDVSPQRTLSFVSDFILLSAGCMTALLQLCMYLFFVDRAARDTEGAQKNAWPVFGASVVSRISFAWCGSIVIKAFKTQLSREQLWNLPSFYRCGNVAAPFNKYWSQQYHKARSRVCVAENGFIELEHVNGTQVSSPIIHQNQHKANEPNKASLFRTIIRSRAHAFILSVFLKIITECFIFTSPYLLRLLLAAVRNPDELSVNCYLLALAMFVVTLSQSIVQQHFNALYMLTGMKIRASIMSAVYRKSLRISPSARMLSTVGEIVNLMAVDAARYNELMHYLNTIWIAPFQVALALYFLWGLLGGAALAGFVALFVIIPINLVIIRATKKLEIVYMKQKDSRMKMMNEVLSGIKLYAWETSFEEKVTQIRNKELRILMKTQVLSTISMFASAISPLMVTLLSFGAYVLSSPDHVLTAEKAFVSLSLFNIMRSPLVALPGLFNGMIQLYVSNNRISTFLKRDEIDFQKVKKDVESDDCIQISNGSYSWGPEAPPTLKMINLSVRPGALVAVVGAVGCGKSSLLSALLGEMETLSGHTMIKGSIAYVPQIPWVQHASLKDNVLFDTTLDQPFYDRVIADCGLLPDLKILPMADLTEIGERGINLSGGQKLRVSLARAVYSMADVFLLDDPLSAVDVHVGKHIFDNIIGPNGILKEKLLWATLINVLLHRKAMPQTLDMTPHLVTVYRHGTNLSLCYLLVWNITLEYTATHFNVFVTHGLTFLPSADVIVVMSDGRVSEMGSFNQLMCHAGPFAELLTNYYLSQQNQEFPTDHAIKDENMVKRLGVLKEEWKNSLGSLNKLSVQDFRTRTFSDGNYQKFLDNKNKKSGNFWKSTPCVAAKPLNKPSTIRQRSLQKSTTDLIEPDDLIEVDNGIIADEDESVIDEGYRGTDKAVLDDTQKTAVSPEQERLVKDEHVEIGRVKLSVYSTYLRAIGFWRCFLFFFLTAVHVGFAVVSALWLADWTRDADSNRTVMTPSSEQSSEALRDMRLGVYAAFGFFDALFTSLGHGAGLFACRRTSRVQHETLLHNVLAAGMDFFDQTPTGRSLNRFGGDVEVMDTSLPRFVLNLVRLVLTIFGSIILVSIATPWALLVWCSLAVVYVILQRVHVHTSRQVQRLVSVNRSPIYAHFSETLAGVSTVRAYCRQRQFTRESEQRIDNYNRCLYTHFMLNRGTSTLLETMGNGLVLISACLAIHARRHLSVGLIGMSITSALNVTSTLGMVVRQSAAVENQIISVERIKEYIEITPEAPRIIKNSRPKPEWPPSGNMIFTDYSTRYREGQNLVLKEMNVNIDAGEKVGIVGRTGAGKSSLTLALFRIIEAAGGTISIDGIDISKIGLHDLRSKLTIIPQDPVLFSGSLRMNLDPFDVHSDERLWSVLEKAHLKDFILTLDGGLHFQFSEGGENLSVGQRQLICLARALLRHTKVLVLDEATAAVDLETDDLIQETIRSIFADCTVLTIAHRLNTILDYTKIMVLDAGRIIEYDTPKNLLNDEKSVFHGMVKESNGSQ